jgi:hypothetical protein
MELLLCLRLRTGLEELREGVAAIGHGRVGESEREGGVGTGERRPLAERRMQNERNISRMRVMEAAAAKCSTRCSSRWSSNSSGFSLILQMQQHMEMVLRTKTLPQA